MKSRALEKIGTIDNSQKSSTSRSLMQDGFPYVEINGLFFCLNQNPAKLAGFLFLGSKSLRLRSAFQKKRLIRALKSLILYQLGLKKAKEVRKFHLYCHLILKVHGGYRAFDFKKKTVTKIISADLSQMKVNAEIEGVRRAAQLDFAPRIVCWNSVERWYIEEYVDGVIGYSLVQPNAKASSNLFGKKIIRCLGKMILLKSPTKMTVGEIINRCNKSWERDRLCRAVRGHEKLNAFYQFLQLTVSKLFRRADQSIYLIFSHGDFSLQNILITENGLKVIDWESTSNRSVLYDLYNFFFTELYYSRASKCFVNEVNEAIISLQSYLASDRSEKPYNLIELAEIYRWLYYIERIFMLLERGLNEQLLNVIYRSVEVFKEFEKAVENKYGFDKKLDFKNLG